MVCRPKPLPRRDLRARRRPSSTKTRPFQPSHYEGRGGHRPLVSRAQDPVDHGAVIAVVVAGAVFGGWYFLNQQDQQASFELSQAVRTMDTPLRPANMPPEPDNPTFASSKERATEASKQLRNVVDKYPHTSFGGIRSLLFGRNRD